MLISRKFLCSDHSVGFGYCSITRARVATKENHYVKLREDVFFKIHGVEPGDYDFVIQLYDQPAGCLVEAVGTRIVPITVTL